MEDAPRVGIYCRISKDRVGAGLGVDRQREDCNRFVTDHGWTVAEEYVDNDLSAYSGRRRPRYEALLADIESGRITAVVAWHADRLHRSTVELERYIAICEPRHVPTYTVRAGELDLSTAAGRMMARVTGAVARHESEQKSERVKRQKQEAAESGKWRGGPRPFGFEPDGITHRKAEADALRDCARRLLAGESLYQVALGLHASGVTTTAGARWREGNLKRTLLRARYAGLVEHDGQVIGEAEWAPILDVDTWHAVVRLFEQPRKPYASGLVSSQLVGSGLYRCYCGHTVFSAGTSNSGKPRYRCSTGHMGRTAPSIDEHVHEVIKQVLRDLGAALLPPEQDTSPLRNRLATLEARQQELAATYADPDAGMTAAQFALANRQLNAAVAEVAAEIARIEPKSVLAGVADAEDPAREYERAPLSRQRSIIDAMCTVTLLRVSQGARPFDPGSVRIDPKLGHWPA